MMLYQFVVALTFAVWFCLVILVAYFGLEFGLLGLRFCAACRLFIILGLLITLLDVDSCYVIIG